jgi:hypothetical protein
MTELTIIIPSIHPERWDNVAKSIVESCGGIDHQLIFVGPKCKEPLTAAMDMLPAGSSTSFGTYTYIKDLGTSTVAFQKAALQANGEYITIAADDSLARPGAIESCFKHFRKNYKPSDLMICTYIEGVNLPDYPHPRTSMFGDFYWRALHQFQTHRQKGILQGLEDWYWGQFLINTEYFIELGGLDCAYIHMNFSLHDLCYRVLLIIYGIQTL